MLAVVWCLTCQGVGSSSSSTATVAVAWGGDVVPGPPVGGPPSPHDLVPHVPHVAPHLTSMTTCTWGAAGDRFPGLTEIAAKVRAFTENGLTFWLESSEDPQAMVDASRALLHVCQRWLATRIKAPPPSSSSSLCLEPWLEELLGEAMRDHWEALLTPSAGEEELAGLVQALHQELGNDPRLQDYREHPNTTADCLSACLSILGLAQLSKPPLTLQTNSLGQSYRFDPSLHLVHDGKPATTVMVIFPPFNEIRLPALCAALT